MVDITYLLFYAYNGDVIEPIHGVHVGRHEADWERMTVRVDLDLDGSSRIHSMHYAGHGGGEWVYPIPACTDPEGPCGPPVIYVARYTHAAYPDNGLDGEHPREIPEKVELFCKLASAPFAWWNIWGALALYHICDVAELPADRTSTSGLHVQTADRVVNVGERYALRVDPDPVKGVDLSYLLFSGRWGPDNVPQMGSPYGNLFKGTWIHENSGPGDDTEDLPQHNHLVFAAPGGGAYPPPPAPSGIRSARTSPRPSSRAA